MRSPSGKGHSSHEEEPLTEREAQQPGIVTTVPLTRVSTGRALKLSDFVARESSLVLSVNGLTLCRLQCSPAQVEELAIGFLFTAGLFSFETARMPVRCEVGQREVRVDVPLDLGRRELQRLRENLVAGTGCGLGLFSVKGLDPLDCRRKIDLSFRVQADEIKEAMKSFQGRPGAYRETGGVHGAAIAEKGRLLIFTEDVGRHNAVDKAIGWCVRAGLRLEDKLVLSTGRLTFDVAAKCVRAGLPLVASRSAPTDSAIELARLANLTLVGFARGDRMNIYTAEWRIE